MTVAEVLREGIECLKKNGVNEPIGKARMLLAFTLNKSKEELMVNDDEKISDDDKLRYIGYIQELIDKKPLQYIIGKQEFMKMDFWVNEYVLIPRQDTEILVEETITIAEKIKEPLILDLCTGSGIISISIAKNIEKTYIVATDISANAINTAILNSKKNDVHEKIKFITSNLFEDIDNGNKFDIIVCNPPYIKTRDLENLEEVRREPRIALDGGKDGLDFYREIISKAHEYLNSNGYLCFEIGYDQKDEVMDLIKKSNKYENIYSKKDFGNDDRIVVCKLKE